MLVNFLRPARQAQVLERTSYDDRALECMRQLGIRGRKPGELRCARRWPAVAGRARGGAPPGRMRQCRGCGPSFCS